MQMALFHSFLWLSNIPLHVCVYIYICVCVGVCVYLIFFIHSSVDGRLGCFHVWAIVNSAAMNKVVSAFGILMHSIPTQENKALKVGKRWEVL